MAAAPTPRRPYLVRAMHEWMTANNQTPHLVVDAASPAAEVPRAYVRDGRITLNVSWQATQGLKLGNEWIEFSARFGGVSQHVRIPVVSVLGIYARETGQGTAEPTKLIAPMLARFMATDRVFAKIRRATQARSTGRG